MDITEHIKKNGLSREKICQEAGISRSFLSLIERDVRKPGTETVGGWQRRSVSPFETSDRIWPTSLEAPLNSLSISEPVSIA